MADGLDDLRRRAEAAYEGGRLAEAVELQARLLEAGGGRRDDALRLALYRFTAGRHAEALAGLEAAQARRPDDTEIAVDRGVLLLRLGRHAEAAALLESVLPARPGDANLRDCLAHAHGALGDLAAARRHGERSLLLKDAAAGAASPPDWPAAPPFRADRPERNVIAFSLWGEAPRYWQGALRNAELAPVVYPEWRCRFYCDDTVPAGVRERLLALGADVVGMPAQTRLFEGLFWRFRVAADPAVDRFLVRDADSVVNLRERAAVDEWLDGGRPFHVMRDHYLHTDPILAGLWGGVAGLLPPLDALAEAWLARPGRSRTCDQEMLRERVWPLLRNHVLVHDGVYRCFGARPFPPHARLPAGHNVGRAEPALRPPGEGRLFRPVGSRLEPVAPRRRFVFALGPLGAGAGLLAELLAANLPELRVQPPEQARLPAELPAHFAAGGNLASVRAFWQRRLATLRYGPGDGVADTSPLPAQAGLLENLDILGAAARIDVVLLSRDTFETARHLLERFDLDDPAGRRALPPPGRRSLVGFAPFRPHGAIGHAVWYVLEMQARGLYYRRLLSGWPNLRFHDAALAELVTPAGAEALLGALGRPAGGLVLPPHRPAPPPRPPDHAARRALRALVDRLRFDAGAIVDARLRAGRLLG